MATKDKLVAEFTFRNPTKRTFRFEQVGGEEIKTLYVAQSADIFKNLKGQPKKIRVTVEVI